MIPHSSLKEKQQQQKVNHAILTAYVRAIHVCFVLSNHLSTNVCKEPRRQKALRTYSLEKHGITERIRQGRKQLSETFLLIYIQTASETLGMSIQPVCPDSERTPGRRKHFQQGEVILTVMFVSVPCVACLHDKRDKIKRTSFEAGSMATCPQTLTSDDLPCVCQVQ